MQTLTIVAALTGALAGCQPPDDEAAPATGPLVIEGPAEGARLQVRPPDVEPFDVTLGAATRVRVEHSPGSAPRADVMGRHLAFVADATELEYQTTDELWLWQGLVRVSRGLWVSDVHMHEGHLVGTARPDPDVVVEGLRWPAERLLPTRRALAETWWDGTTDPLPLENAPVRAYATGASLTLHASPGDARTLRFVPDSPEYTLLDVLQTAGDWTEVSWKRELMELRGWTPTGSLHFVDDLRGMMWGRTSCGGSRMHRGSKPARVTLTAGTIIHAQAARGPWARVHTALAVEVVSDGAGWGQIIQLPDVDDAWMTENAWVDLRPLTLEPAP